MPATLTMSPSVTRAPTITMPATLTLNHTVTRAPAPQKRNLLVAPPSIAAHEEKLHALFKTYDRSVTDLQMLDRLSAGRVSLPPSTYGLVLVLTDADGSLRDEALRLLNRAVYNVVVPSMAPGGTLRLQEGKLEDSHASEAVLAGLIEKDGSYEKPEYEAVSVPLRLGGKKKKRTLQNGLGATTNGSKSTNGDDELIDEEGLLTEEDFTRTVKLPNGCNPTIAKKRKKACRDCSCGLTSELEAEDKAKKEEANKALNVLKFNPDELDDEETDFTVQGRTGSCGSCNLGDAFRCEGCPYVGMPPFKPGEEITIINELIQL